MIETNNKPSIEEILNSGCTCCTMREIYCEHCLLYKKYNIKKDEELEYNGKY